MGPRFFRRRATLGLALAALTGCMDQDPFALSQRRIAGPYLLEQAEDGRYYLRGGPHDQPGVGVLAGTVERLGWTPHYILARRRASLGAAGDGWMVLEVATGRLTGPLSDEQVAERSALPRASEALPVAEAWSRLGLSPLSWWRIGGLLVLGGVAIVFLWRRPVRRDA